MKSMPESNDTLLLADQERQLLNQAAKIRKLQAKVMDLESDLSDIVQAAEKGDVEELERAIADTKALLLARGWTVCRDCGEVYWPPDWGRTKEDGCPNCEEIEPDGH
jgi:hypothetical protein